MNSGLSLYGPLTQIEPGSSTAIWNSMHSYEGEWEGWRLHRFLKSQTRLAHLSVSRLSPSRKLITGRGSVWPTIKFSGIFSSTNSSDRWTDQLLNLPTSLRRKRLLNFAFKCLSMDVNILQATATGYSLLCNKCQENSEGQKGNSSTALSEHTGTGKGSPCRTHTDKVTATSSTITSN